MSNGEASAVGGGAIHGPGIFGAWVWFLQRVDGLWANVLAFLQDIFWPAFRVDEVARTPHDDG